MTKFLANTSLRKAIIFAIVSILLIATGTFLFVSRMTTAITAEANLYLEEVAKQGAGTIKEIVRADAFWVKTIADTLGKYASFDNIYPILTFLEEERAQKGYKRIGLITPDEEVFLSNGLTWEMLESYNRLTEGQAKADQIYARKTLREEIPLSTKLYDREDGTPILIQSAPIRQNGEVVAALFTTRALSDYEKLLSISFFDGEGYSYLVNDFGEIIISANDSKSPLTEDDNIFVAMTSGDTKFQHGETASHILENMENGKSGSASYKMRGIEKYVHYLPVGIDNWYMFSIVETKNINKRTNRLSFFAFGLASIITIVFLSICAFLVLSSKKYEEKLYTTAFIDKLTSAHNISRFKLDCEEILEDHPYNNYALIMFDVDKFKIINSLYGDRQGDLVLQHIINVLSANIHGEDIYARTGADIFVILLKYNMDEDIVNKIKKLDVLLRDCYATTDNHYAMTLSYGIYKITEKDLPFYTIFDRANIARIAAKRNPAVIHAFYSPALEEGLLQQKFVESNIKRALSRMEIEVYFHPIFNLKTGELFAAETLSRWNHSTKGIVMPGEYIPVLEKSGSIIPFDYYILQNTARILGGWIKKGLPIVPIAVNHSRLHVNNPDYPSDFKAVFDKENVPTKYIEVEMAESAIAENIDRLPGFAEKLHRLGFKISMDDFGTGYSSLNILKSLQVDIIKLDKGFLTDFDTNPRSREIIKASVGLIKKLNIEIIAEGVETQQQADFLRSIGCDYVQGFLFSKPITADEFEKILASKKAK